MSEVADLRRLPLTAGDRGELRAQTERGNFSSNLLAPDSSPYDLTACPSAGSRGLIFLGDGIHAGDGLELDDARRFAQALLMLADHCEFGPGEWANGEWRQTWSER